MLKVATLQSTGGKLICKLVTDAGNELSFEVADRPDLKFGRSEKADNTHVDVTLTVRVANLVTVTNQPDLM